MVGRPTGRVPAAAKRACISGRVQLSWQLHPYDDSKVSLHDLRIPANNTLKKEGGVPIALQVNYFGDPYYVSPIKFPSGRGTVADSDFRKEPDSQMLRVLNIHQPFRQIHGWRDKVGMQLLLKLQSSRQLLLQPTQGWSEE